MTQVMPPPAARRPNVLPQPSRTHSRRSDMLAALLLVAVILLTVFEGAGRKWLFPEYPLLRYAAYFSKDAVFILAAYWGLRKERRFNLSWVVLCGILILIPSVFSTMANSNFVGIGLSFRAYLVIPLCAFLAAPLIRNFRDVEHCAMAVAVSAIVVAAVGAYQYSLPKTHFLNRYDSGAEDTHVASAAGHVRATGTFAYIGGMAIMSGFSAWAGMLLVFPLRGRAGWVRLLGAAALVGGLTCASVSMSRGGLMFWCITVAGSLLLYLRASQVLVAGLAVVAVVSALLTSRASEDLDVLNEQPSLASGLIHRIGSSDSFAERGHYVIENLIQGVVNHPFGEGLGVGQPGGMYASYGIRSSLGYESEWGRIAYEIGPAGLLGVLLMRFVAGLICWRALLQTTDVHRRLVLATAIAFFGIMSLGWMAFNHVGNSAAWAVLALALALAAVPRQQQQT